MATDKIYVGSGKAVTTKYGEMLKLSFSRKDVETMLTNLNEKGWVNLVCSERQTPGKYGDTHSLSIDSWKPTGERPTGNDGPVDLDNLPF